MALPSGSAEAGRLCGAVVLPISHPVPLRTVRAPELVLNDPLSETMRRHSRVRIAPLRAPRVGPDRWQRGAAVVRRRGEFSGVARRDPQRRAVDPVRMLHLRRRRSGTRIRQRHSPRGRVRACAVHASTTGSARSVGALWPPLIAAGGEVRAFNPPRFDSPLGWLSRITERRSRSTGVSASSSAWCQRQMAGQPGARMEPWRDAGIEIAGPRSPRSTHAFAARLAGVRRDAVAADLTRRIGAGWRDGRRHACACCRIAQRHGHLSARSRDRVARPPVSYGSPTRISSARRRMCRRLRRQRATGSTCGCWCPAPATFRRCRRCRAPAIGRCSKSGVRVFEWNGTMLHAKTAVADGLWSRIGSTNLNIASWMGNYELDVAIEDVASASAMAAQYETDLARATEIVLTRRNRVRADRMRTPVRRRVAHDRAAPDASPPARSAWAARWAPRSPIAARWVRRIGVAREGEPLRDRRLPIVAAFWPRASRGRSP